MAFKILEQGAAPKSVRSNQNLAKQSEYDAYVKQVVESGKVGGITPEGKDNTRSVAHSLTHAARRQGVNIETWVAAGVVYFQKTDKVRTKRKAKAAAPATAEAPKQEAAKK